jgi:transcriptional regulator with XRE-family HTH domain/predicted transcriptional regulator
MSLTEENIRLIFGLKLKQLREKKSLSLSQLAKITGLSKSYINEIEKGKKYPKTDKIVSLASALGVSYDEIVSLKLTGNLAPVAALIQSGILKEIPLSLFGIEENTLIDIVFNAPTRFTAFINTIFDLTREYNISKENFYLAALKSYQESHLNYFDDLERKSELFAQTFNLAETGKHAHETLANILAEHYGYTIEYNLDPNGELHEVRSIFIEGEKPKLLLAENISESQKAFILAKELGYCFLEIKLRPKTFSWIKFETFDEVFNNFRASYFAGALLIPQKSLALSLKDLFNETAFNPNKFLDLIFSYTDSIETFFQRLTNILPAEFDLKNLFFLRIKTKPGSNYFEINKEFHLNKQHKPHGNKSEKHYCRRWLSIDLLSHPEKFARKHGTVAHAQISQYSDPTAHYLILSAASADPFVSQFARSVCVGIEITSNLKRKIKFLDDINILRKSVGVTCETCPILHCTDRVAEPVVLNKIERQKAIEAKVTEILNG